MLQKCPSFEIPVVRARLPPPLLKRHIVQRGESCRFQTGQMSPVLNHLTSKEALVNSTDVFAALKAAGKKFKAARGLLWRAKGGAARTSASLHCPPFFKQWLLICKWLISSNYLKNKNMLHNQRYNIKANYQTISLVIQLKNTFNLHYKKVDMCERPATFQQQFIDIQQFLIQFLDGKTTIHSCKYMNKTPNQVTLLPPLIQSHKSLRRKINAGVRPQLQSLLNPLPTGRSRISVLARGAVMG